MRASPVLAFLNDAPSHTLNTCFAHSLLRSCKLGYSQATTKPPPYVAQMETSLKQMAAKLSSGAAPQTMSLAKKIFSVYEKSTLTGPNNSAVAGRSDVDKHKDVYAAACLHLALGGDKKDIKDATSILR